MFIIGGILTMELCLMLPEVEADPPGTANQPTSRSLGGNP